MCVTSTYGIAGLGGMKAFRDPQMLGQKRFRSPNHEQILREFDAGLNMTMSDIPVLYMEPCHNNFSVRKPRQKLENGAKS
jgi:hypothetical protein